MCVIVHKPAGVAPDIDKLRQCFNKNPDGAGYMVLDPDTKLVKIHKGFFKFKKFKRAISQLDPMAEAVYHFRISTHGAVNADNCHPFALRPEPTSTLDLAPVAVCHNGQISGFGDDKTVSDTQEFVRTVLPMIQDVNLMIKLLDSIGGSKFCLMDKEGAVLKVGTFHEVDGAYYSNLHWKPVVSTIGYGGKYGSAYTPASSAGSESLYPYYSGYANTPDADLVTQSNLPDDWWIDPAGDDCGLTADDLTNLEALERKEIIRLIKQQRQDIEDLCDELNEPECKDLTEQDKINWFWTGVEQIQEMYEELLGAENLVIPKVAYNKANGFISFTVEGIGLLELDEDEDEDEDEGGASAAAQLSQAEQADSRQLTIDGEIAKASDNMRQVSTISPLVLGK
jgi:hypothetical protein